MIPRFSVAFRCKLVLMIVGEYAYGDHVSDERAFIMRCRRLDLAYAAAIVVKEQRRNR
jgi:hypothetical protein